MLSTPNPFTGEQLFNSIKHLFTKEGLFVAFFSILAGIVNHVILAPIAWKVVGLLALIFFFMDIVTGTLRSKRVNASKYCLHSGTAGCQNRSELAGKGFNSRDFGRTFIKFIVYGTVFLIGTAFDYALSSILGFPLLYVFSGGALAMVAFREFKSNAENLHALWLCTHEPYPFGSLMDRLEKLLRFIVGKMDKTPEELCGRREALSNEEAQTPEEIQSNEENNQKD